MITTEQINEILYDNIKSVINHKHKADIINCIKAAYALAESEKDKEIAELKKEAQDWKNLATVLDRTIKSGK